MTTTIQPDMTVQDLRTLLTPQLRDRKISAYDLARTLLDVLGCSCFEQAAQQASVSCPKTLRRIFSQGVPMCMSPEVQKKEHTHTDSLAELTGMAAEAGVNPRQAVSAHVRYGNALERVTQVLRDIRALALHGAAARNPTGLFVRLMRSGDSVRLPERALQVRRALDAQPEAIKNDPPPVGAWVRYCGDWMRVQRVQGGMVRLCAPEGLSYTYWLPGADTDVTVSAAAVLDVAPPELAARLSGQVQPDQDEQAGAEQDQQQVQRFALPAQRGAEQAVREAEQQRAGDQPVQQRRKENRFLVHARALFA